LKARGAASRTDSLVISVRAKPRSSVSELQLEPGGTWIARLTSPPVDGKANAELIALVAKQFGCAKSAVCVLSGGSARLKLVKITGTRARQPDGAQ